MNKKIKRAFLDPEDGQIQYRITGEGKPLLLLHQNQQSSNEYLEMMPLLPKTYHVIAAELNHRLVLDDLKCSGYPLCAVWAVANYCLTMEQQFFQIKCPTLIIWVAVDLKQFEKLGLARAENRYLVLKAIPQAKMIDIQGRTICMMNQMPEQISKVVIESLEKNQTEVV